MNKILYIIYAILFFAFTIYSFVFIDPGFFYLEDLYTGIAFSQRLHVVIAYVVFIVSFFFCYALLLRVKQAYGFSFLPIVILAASLVFSYPSILSYDIFNYMATAKVAFFYGENPYMVMPIEFIQDPILSYTRAANKFALYGPFWILLTGVPYIVAFQNVLTQLLFLKIFVGLFYFLTLYLLTRFSKNNFTVLFFALNPLVLLETFVSGHNDIVMISLVLFAFLLAQKKRIFFSIIFLTLSILIKYATVFLIPVFVLVYWRYYKKEKIDWDRIWSFSAISMLVIFLLSPLREEMYPWYFIWVLPFIALGNYRKWVYGLTSVASFGLLASYIPYMYFGIYEFPSNIFRVLCIVGPILVYVVYLTISYVFRYKK